MVNISKKKYSRVALQQLIAIFPLLFLQPQPGLGQGLPASYHAAQTALNSLMAPGVNALPDIRQVISGVAGLDKNAAGNRLTIRQNKKKAVLDWNSFDIGAAAETIFDQQGHTNWAALNRIYDRNPSQIYGRLKADGKVFLLNHNGILFGKGSRVNVHSLVASSLNLDQSDFLRNIMHFKTEPGAEGTPGKVSSEGSIQAGQTGSVFLIGPSVENSGTINAPNGQIGLIAGEDVSLDPVSNQEAQTRIASWVKVSGTLGTAANRRGGKLESKSGLVGMYGRVVNQNGMIRTVVALENQGRTGIELLASDHVTTGPKSITEAPISTSTKTQILKSAFMGGKIKFGGLAPGNAKADASTVWIRHEGKIDAPAGSLTMKATQRILLDSGSAIDVSGSWVERPMRDAFVDVKLTSEVLRDDYPQKNGALLGTTVRVNAREGTAIGDISGALANRQNTALQDSTAAGEINLFAGSGDVVINPGASLDFSGGGTIYKSGLVATTKLVADNAAYDIGTASPNLVYNGVFGHYEKKHARYNITDVYAGMSYGNGTMQNFEGFVEGSDAGGVTIEGNALSLNGTLNGKALAGIYQTESEERVNRFKNPVTRGRHRPLGGTMNLVGPFSGTEKTMDNIDAVAIVPGAGSGRRLAMNDPLPTTGVNGISQAATILPADMISAAGLSALNILSDSSINIAKDAVLRLQAGGELKATARLLIDRGTIYIPGGTAAFYSDENMTAYPGGDSEATANKDYISMPEGVILTDTSRVDVSGEKLDNRLASVPGGKKLQHGIIAGGSVILQDKIDYSRGGGQVIIDKGAVVDVSGGYEVTPVGGVIGGDGGSIDLQGTAILPVGTLLGRSVAGAAGGSISIHSERVLVGGPAPKLPGREDGTKPLPVNFFAGYLPDDLQSGPVGSGKIPARAKGLVLDPAWLRDSGFAHVTVKSVGDLFVQGGAKLTPSAVKLSSPLRGMAADGSSGQKAPLIWLPDDLLGAVSLDLAAGQEFNWQDDTNQAARRLDKSRLIVKENAVLKMPPTVGAEKSVISLRGPMVEIAGQVTAPAGDIKIEAVAATQAPLIHVTSTATISAAGVNIPNRPSGGGQQPMTYTSLDAGSIALKAELGQVTVDKGARLDVSGSKPAAAGYYQDSSGSEKIHEIVSAGKAGSLNIEFGSGLELKGKIQGGSALSGLEGGRLAITRDINDTALTISASDMGSWLDDGFESLSLASYSEIRFSGAIERVVPRTLSLDAPVISGSGGDIRLTANYVRLGSSKYAFVGGGTADDSASGSLDISANWLDVEGASYFKGFDTVSLRSRNDLTLADIYSTVVSGGVWLRTMTVDNDLILRAARIYPKTGVDFSIKAAGLVSLLSSGEKRSRGPIYSAGSRLTIEGRGIDLQGYLSAPMGSLSLTAAGDGRIFLAPGSIISTKGEADVHYGQLGEENWSVASKTGNPSDMAQGRPVNEAPRKSIALKGNEVIISRGAAIDAGGGGAVSSTFFLPGLEGSVNPLNGKYVILPGHSAARAGAAVYLEGSKKLGLRAGVYSLLPAEYAFEPGALVVESLGTRALPGQQRATVRQGVVLAGYKTETGIEAASPLQSGFWVRSAPDVLREGHFTASSLKAGAGGSVSLQAKTAVLAGSIRAAALPDYTGGILDLAVRNDIEIGSGSALLPADFSFASKIPKALAGKFFLDGGAVSNAGLSKMTLGTISYDNNQKIIAAATTDSITLLKDTRLAVPELVLNAEKISLGSRAVMESLAGKGTMRLTAGRVDTAAGSELHAAHDLSIQTDTLDMNGTLKVDNSSLSLLSSNMYFLPQGVSYRDAVSKGADPEGMYLPYALREEMRGLKSVTLRGRYGIEFLADTSLNVAGDLTLDSALLTADGDHTVSLNAARVNLLHSGAETAAQGGNAGGGSLSISGGLIQAGRGDMLVDGFRQVSLSAKDDLVFRGQGSLIVKGGLKLSASRVTTSYYREGNEPYQPADFTVQALGGLTILPVAHGRAAETQKVPGGSLELIGKRVDISGDIEVPAGNLLVKATGKALDGDGIYLRDGALLAALGNVYENKIQTGGGERVLSTVAPGGRIALQANEGRISLSVGSLIDVSTVKGGGQAGEISLYAPEAGVALGGKLAAQAADGGNGGALSLATDSIGDFSSFYAAMEHSGFSRAMRLGVRSGDIVIGAVDVVTTPNLSLSSAKGNIVVNGTIDASTAGDGGTVELYGKNVELDGGRVLAEGKKGGRVEMGAVVGENMDDTEGLIEFKNGALVDVSGSSGMGGKVYLRAGLNKAGDDVKVQLNGTITGAAQTVVEAVDVYQLNSGTDELKEAKLSNWGLVTKTFMAAQQAGSGKGRSRLLSELGRDVSGTDNFHLRPGIEVRNVAGLDLNVRDKLDLSDSFKWRYNGEPGVLTLRSRGNLTVNGSIIDAPTAAPAGENPSWGINLIAGADTTSANVMAVNNGSGDFKVGNDGSESFIFSDSGAVRFASGGSTTIGKGVKEKGYFYFKNSGVPGTSEKLDYTISSTAGDISGWVGGDLLFDGGAIQDGSGSISLSVDGSLKLANGTKTGAIRTIGKPPEELDNEFKTALQNMLQERHIPSQRQAAIINMLGKPIRLQQYWGYHDGGDISIKVRKSYESPLLSNISAWDAAYRLKLRGPKLSPHWSADYDGKGSLLMGSRPLRGLAAMGGGSVAVRVGGDFTGQAGTFGTGDLLIRAGGDINGRFLVARGQGTISSMSNIGSKIDTSAKIPTVLELLDARVNVSAQGDLLLGDIVNPTIASNWFNKKAKLWNLTYSHTQIDPETGQRLSADTAAHLTSVFGNLALSGDYDTYYPRLLEVSENTHYPFIHVLPPVLDLKAGRDIRLSGFGAVSYNMAPSPTGQLSMIAGGNISGQIYSPQNSLTLTREATVIPNNLLTINMADMDSAAVYGDHGKEGVTSDKILTRMSYQSGVSKSSANGVTTAVPLHGGDKEPVTIMAGGDISALNLSLAKQARIMAGGSIYAFNYQGQNVAAGDVSEITAKGDISLERSVDHNFGMAIQQGGPGFLLVKADNSLNLGTSAGITSVGNSNNLSLDADGSALGIMAGYARRLSEIELRDFFDRLRQAGQEYSSLLAEGSDDAAAKVLADTRRDVILPALGSADGPGGNLDMINSKIRTSGGADDIFMAVRGDINVGRTTFSTGGGQQSTGITTVRGGAVNLFTGHGDLNVNESRLMSFMGGDITAWCDYGNINAGRGSTTAISAEGETFTRDADGNLIPVFSPPSVGSGIRTLTFDPDGSAGPMSEPEAGSVYLFAPAGEIDAGEAGIAGTNVILAATKVVNAQNISFSQGGVGVPAGGGAVGGIGALSGAGDLSGMGRSMSESTAALSRAKNQFAAESAKLAKAFQLKWVSVEFTGFGSK